MANLLIEDRPPVGWVDQAEVLVSRIDWLSSFVNIIDDVDEVYLSIESHRHTSSDGEEGSFCKRGLYRTLDPLVPSSKFARVCMYSDAPKLRMMFNLLPNALRRLGG